VAFKNVVFPSRLIVVLGVVLFIIGLLVVLRETPFFSGVSQLVPDAQIALVIGAVAASLGQTLLVFGIVKANSDKLLRGLRFERQLTMTAVARNMDQMHLTMQDERQTVLASYQQTMTKLDRIVANQKELPSDGQTKELSACKFCGTKMEKNAFCPQCGKADF
jgi:NADH pyrophosphatase NudC (nudix superfamily)